MKINTIAINVDLSMQQNVSLLLWPPFYSFNMRLQLSNECQMNFSFLLVVVMGRYMWCCHSVFQCLSALTTEFANDKWCICSKRKLVQTFDQLFYAVFGVFDVDRSNREQRAREKQSVIFRFTILFPYFTYSSACCISS